MFLIFFSDPFLCLIFLCYYIRPFFPPIDSRTSFYETVFFVSLLSLPPHCTTIYLHDSFRLLSLSLQQTIKVSTLKEFHSFIVSALTTTQSLEILLSFCFILSFTQLFQHLKNWIVGTKSLSFSFPKTVIVS